MATTIGAVLIKQHLDITIGIKKLKSGGDEMGSNHAFGCPK